MDVDGGWLGMDDVMVEVGSIMIIRLIKMKDVSNQSQQVNQLFDHSSLFWNIHLDYAQLIQSLIRSRTLSHQTHPIECGW
jgi:hypothetical protein